MEGQSSLNRMIVAVLALVGLLISLYLLTHSMGLMGQLVCGVGDCETVQSSQWSRVGPIPVPALGVAGYAALLIIALRGLGASGLEDRRIPLLLILGTGIGTAFSGYLTYLEAFVIHAWCQWCVGSAILITLAFFASVPEFGRLRANR